jgi:Rrf2 family iron-sulfur cluster assembly transcriptional regulator
VKLTTKGRYAVTAMLDLAMHEDQLCGVAAACPLALCEIAERQSISPAYLERLFAGLRRHGLVVATRGACGGYRLARAAETISVANVMAAVREDLDATKCGGEKNCNSGAGCLTHDLWQDLTRHVQDYLDDISLADLVSRARQRSVPKQEVPVKMFSPMQAMS